MPIRLRLTIWYSGLLLVIIGLLGIAVLTILDRTLRVQVDNTLDDAIVDLESNLEIYVDSETDNEPVNILLDFPENEFEAPDIYYQLWSRVEQSGSSDDVLTSLSFNLGAYHKPLDHAALDSDEKIRRNVIINDIPMRVITVPVTHDGRVIGHLQVGASLHSTEQTTDRLLRIMIIGGGVALLASVLMGNWLSGRVLKPISEISRAAQHTVAADDLGYRIPGTDQNDEIGHLVTTFNQMLERLERLFNAQRQFVSDVSHELRTPLTSIQGNVELIQRFGYDAALVAIIFSESQRMSRIVNELLMLAQADVGHLPLDKNPVALEQIVQQVYHHAWQQVNEDVEIVLDAVEPVEINIDSNRVKQLFTNLMANSLTYTTSGQITLSLKKAGAFAEFRITDTGIGIPAEHLPHIFDRFYRVDKARSRQAGGTGLGLSIARWIAEAHQGSIEVESTVNKGSTFIVRLPL